jgi:preprotein translocase subunit SecA
VALRAEGLPVAQTTQVLDRKDEGMSLEEENEKLIERLSLQIEDINAMEGDFDALDNDEMRAKTEELRQRIQAAGEIRDAEINEAVALLREAVWRVLELWYFDVQLLGGLVLHSGRLAEMKTGEGKTITALLPTFLAALEGKGGCYVVTPNDYLARRDAENVGQVLRFLGVSVGLIQATMESEDRQKAYKNDVVYLTNAELGFDYLRDNLAVYPSQIVQSKPFYFALVDEADSILIDEARTPLIISESVPAVPRQFLAAREVAMALQNDLHYTVDEKNMNVVMTDLGEKVAGELLGTDNMWSPDEAWILYTLNALKAKELFKINEQYIVRDGKVAIVDTFTGRVLEGRRWSDGMHQAIECKEKIDVSVRSQVSAQITYQSLFRLFPKLCAMTGTALTEAAEFDEIYALRGTAIPTARPNVRRDYPDVVYKTEEAKLEAIVDEIVMNTERNGRPILVGTSNVKWSEELVNRLRERGVEPNLLNARAEYVAKENETIAQAGRLGKVTVSTNMAGRGTDIILGGNHSSMATLNVRARLAEKLLPLEEMGKVPAVDEDFYPCSISAELDSRIQDAVDALAESPAAEQYGSFLAIEELMGTLAGEAPFEQNDSFPLMVELRQSFNALKQLFKDALAEERKNVIEAGGLYVLGTTRHESRRIDNQLRGRAGRQGDPGTTRFFISLQDDVFRVFGGGKIEGLMDRFKLGDKIPLQSPIVNDTLNRVQTAVEEFFKKTRTTLFEFDKVISKQRELTYQTRRNFLAAEDSQVRGLIEKWGDESVEIHMGNVAEKTHEEKIAEFKEYYGFDMPSVAEFGKLEEGQEFDKQIVDTLQATVREGISKKWDEYEEFRPGFPIEAARIATVVTIDDEWKDLLQKMDALKQTVGLAAYKGREPLKEYQMQGFRMYERCANNYKARSVSRWLRSKPKKQQQQE